MFGLELDSLLLDEEFKNYRLSRKFTVNASSGPSKSGLYQITFDLNAVDELFMVGPSKYYSAFVRRNGNSVLLMCTGNALEIQTFTVNAGVSDKDPYGLQVLDTGGRVMFDSRFRYLKCKDVVGTVPVQSGTITSNLEGCGFIPLAPASTMVITTGGDFVREGILTDINNNTFTIDIASARFEGIMGITSWAEFFDCLFMSYADGPGGMYGELGFWGYSVLRNVDGPDAGGLPTVYRGDVMGYILKYAAFLRVYDGNLESETRLFGWQTSSYPFIYPHPDEVWNDTEEVYNLNKSGLEAFAQVFKDSIVKYENSPVMVAYL